MNAGDSARACLEGCVIGVANLGSGGIHEAAVEQMKHIFAEAGLDRAEVFGVGPHELDAALEDAVARADAVVILGGDGTIRSAAIKCGAAGKPAIPLPGGTMNMLPRALYGPHAWPEALAATLANPRLQEVSGGLAETEAFFCAAILGAPTLWADAREALRRLDLVGAARGVVTAIRRSRGWPLRYHFDDAAPGFAEAIAIICPLVSRALGSDEPSLEAAAVEPQTAASLFRLAFHAVFEDWRVDPGVSLKRVQTARVVGHGRVPVIVDGETVRMGRTVNVRFAPHAFTALVPADA